MWELGSFDIVINRVSERGGSSGQIERPQTDRPQADRTQAERLEAESLEAVVSWVRSSSRKAMSPHFRRAVGRLS